MNYELSEEQEIIRRTARELLDVRLSGERLRGALETGGHDEALWRELCELGWPGIALAEADGGQGLGMIELAVICEELGRALAPVPLIPTAAALLAIAEGGSAEHRERLLAPLAGGGASAGVGTLPGGGRGLLIRPPGCVAAVLFDDQQALLVPGEAGRPAATMDALRTYAGLDGEHVEGEGLASFPAAALDRIDIVLAAELTGVAQRALELAVTHATSRVQFGRAIGSFQGVAHRCARMLLETEKSRSLVLYAAWTADHAPELLPLAASCAMFAAGTAAISVSSGAIQVQGAIGFTWESDAHLLLKRARLSSQLVRTTAWHRRRAAGLRLGAAAGEVQRAAARRGAPGSVLS